MRSQHSPNKSEVMALVEQTQKQVDVEMTKTAPRLENGSAEEVDRTHHVIV
jgi:hypothetical protein